MVNSKTQSFKYDMSSAKALKCRVFLNDLTLFLVNFFFVFIVQLTLPPCYFNRWSIIKNSNFLKLSLENTNAKCMSSWNTERIKHFFFNKINTSVTVLVCTGAEYIYRLILCFSVLKMTLKTRICPHAQNTSHIELSESATLLKWSSSISHCFCNFASEINSASPTCSSSYNAW